MKIAACEWLTVSCACAAAIQHVVRTVNWNQVLTSTTAIAEADSTPSDKNCSSKEPATLDAKQLDAKRQKIATV